ncbi:MAG TPA: redoxin domain-containing protein [Bacteroidota bacterium]|nr:redoxin domain-containing protein [Bacteroidota bacterium]
MEILQKQFRAPDIYGNFWINSEPVSVSALRGYVALVEFWDYTSQGWIRGVPYVREWHRRYLDSGLVVIGVHTPRFPFGRDPGAVRKAVDSFGIKYPVVMDNDFLVWGAYRSTVWPTKYLIDKNGFFRYIHGGEGSYQNFEQAIQSLLHEIGYQADIPPLMDPIRDIDRPGAYCFRATPEILAGWQRGTIGNVEGFAPESTIRYADPGVYVEGRIYLDGDWSTHRSHIRLSEQEGRSGSLTIRYQGREVNVVLEPEGERNFQVFVRQDGMHLDASNSGEDIFSDGEGRSFLKVDEARLFRVVNNREYGEHTLTLTSRSNGLSVYCISFVSCVIPEMIS